MAQLHLGGYWRARANKGVPLKLDYSVWLPQTDGCREGKGAEWGRSQGHLRIKSGRYEVSHARENVRGAARRHCKKYCCFNGLPPSAMAWRYILLPRCLNDTRNAYTILSQRYGYDDSLLPRLLLLVLPRDSSSLPVSHAGAFMWRCNFLGRIMVYPEQRRWGRRRWWRGRAWCKGLRT